MVHHVGRGCSSAGAGTLAFLSAMPPLSAGSTFAVAVTAGTVATVSVAVNSVNTVSATGNIRTTRGGSGSLTVLFADPTALTLTCREVHSSGRRGAATFAHVAPALPAGTLCASWHGPSVFSYDVDLSFGIDAGRVVADAYPLAGGWTIVAAAT